MSREQFSRKIELARLFHYALVPSYVDALRVIANQPFFVKLFDENFLFIDILIAPFRLVTWKSWINLFAESHIKSKIKLLKRHYVFLLQKAPFKAKPSDVNWLKETISSLEEFDQSLDSWLRLKSIVLVFWPIIIGFLLSIYQSGNIYSLLLGLNIGKTALSFTDVAQFGFITMIASLYSPLFGAFPYLYKESLFDKHEINRNEKRMFALFSKRIPIEIPFSAILFSSFLGINIFIILRTYILYGKSYLTPEHVYVFTWFLTSFIIATVTNLEKEKSQQIKSIPFENLEKGLTLADFYYQIGIVKSLPASFDLELRPEVTINGKTASLLSREKVTLEDLVNGQITVTYNNKTVSVQPFL